MTCCLLVDSYLVIKHRCAEVIDFIPQNLQRTFQWLRDANSSRAVRVTHRVFLFYLLKRVVCHGFNIIIYYLSTILVHHVIVPCALHLCKFNLTVTKNFMNY